MGAALLSWCNSNLMYSSYSKLFVGVKQRFLNLNQSTAKLKRTHYGCPNQNKFFVLAATEGSAKSSSKSDETIPSWARPDSNEPPPWARDEGKDYSSSKQNFEIPFYVYLLASAVAAIAAVSFPLFVVLFHSYLP